MHFYTSVNINYLPKARILAKSVKAHCPNAKFSLVFADKWPENVDQSMEPFDEIVTVEQLGIPVKNLPYWIYIHTVVELCTAIKGQALVKFLEEGSEKVVYLDPDIAVFDDLKILENLLDQYDVLLTPHQTAPESDPEDIVANELCSMRYGVYNYGFYAVRNTENGLAYARWWRDRLVDYCFDDIPFGIFTDQRWGDMVPALFDNVCILKHPGCNVSTWNLTHRKVIGDGKGGYLVNGEPLQFYHFSGFDSGAQKKMLDRYSEGRKELYELRDWYIQRMQEEEQDVYGSYPSIYNFYDNGEKIPKEHRELLRKRVDLTDFFGDTNPYVTKSDRSYYVWYQKEGTVEEQSLSAAKAEETLREIYASRSWKLVMKLKRIKNALVRR